MNPILDMLMNAAGGTAVQEVGRRFDLSEEQAGSALNQLVPAIMQGLQRNASQEGGLESLLGALSSGNHSQYLEKPELLGEQATTEDGNAILGHIFGSKNVSRTVAGRAAEETGIGVDVLKKLLPVAATMVMGGLSRQQANAPVQAEEAGGMSFLTSLLDQSRSGSAADEVVGLLGRFLSGR